MIVYSNEPEEYFTFITAECRKDIDSYLDMRKRYGEVLTPDSYLVREQFDVKDQFHISRPRPVTTASIKWKMIDVAKRAGVRSKDVKLAHSHRKRFCSKLIASGVRAEVRLMLEGHSLGITGHYYKPTEEEMYEQYLLAENKLTIDPIQRLVRENNQLKFENSMMADLATKYEEMRSFIWMK